MQQNCYVFNRCNHKDCDKDFCVRKFKLTELYNKALLSETQRYPLQLGVETLPNNIVHPDIEKFKYLSEDICSNNILNFVKEGKNLYLWSVNSGNGKTSWAVRAIRCYLNRIWPSASLTCHALFIDVAEFLNAIKANISAPNEYANYILTNAKQADLVVWDDIGHKAGTSFEINTMLDILNYRLNNKKANIFTSNINPAELKTLLDTRVASRVTESSIQIELVGADKRSWTTIRSEKGE